MPLVRANQLLTTKSPPLRAALYDAGLKTVVSVASASPEQLLAICIKESPYVHEHQGQANARAAQEKLQATKRVLQTIQEGASLQLRTL